MADISDLPVPPKTNISDLPAPPKPVNPIKKELEEDVQYQQEKLRGAELPLLGLVQDIPYKPLQEWAGKKVSEIKQTPEMQGAIINPRTIGEMGTYGLTMLTPEVKALQVTKELPTLLKFLSRVGSGGAIAGGTGAALEPVEAGKDIGKAKGEAAINNALMGATFSGFAPLLYKFGKSTYDILEKAYGGDVRKMADELRNYAINRTGAEAEAAHQLASQAEEKARIAEKIGAKEERKTELQLKELPGVTVQTEAGRFKPIPVSKGAIGEDIKSQADKIYTNLKQVRNANAEKLKADAFNTALAKEKSGQTIADTKNYTNALKYIDDAVKNPDTKLSNVPVQSIRSQLFQVRDALKGTGIDAKTGEVVNHPPSFEGLETLRRSLRDRAYGLPAEGFDAIGQQQAGKLADQVENIMSEFSEGKINKFIDQYRKDSEPLRAFQSKIGKALIDEQLIGKGTNYSKVAAENIPGKVFANAESYRNLVDAFGGNKDYAEAQAKKYFSQQLEELGGDPKKIESYIRKNRDMLNLINSKDMVERYLANVRASTGRGAAARDIAKNYQKQIELQTEKAQDFETLQSKIRVSNNPNEIAGNYENFAQKLRNDGAIDQRQYETMLQESGRVREAHTTAESARSTLSLAARKALLYSGLGLGGVATYYGGRYLFGDY